MISLKKKQPLGVSNKVSNPAKTCLQKYQKAQCISSDTKDIF